MTYLGQVGNLLTSGARLVDSLGPLQMIANIPMLIASLFPPDPRTMFQQQSNVPLGTDPEIFGLKASKVFDELHTQAILPNQHQGFGMLDKKWRNITPQQRLEYNAGMGARAAHSFNVEQAALGEQAILDFANSPVMPGVIADRFLGGVNSPEYRAAVQEKSNEAQIQRRITWAETLRANAATFVQLDPVFDVIGQAFNAGLLPESARRSYAETLRLSQRYLPNVSSNQQSFSSEKPIEQPIEQPVAQAIAAEVSPVPVMPTGNLSTSSGWGGFLTGLTNVVNQVAVPIVNMVTGLRGTQPRPSNYSTPPPQAYPGGAPIYGQQVQGSYQDPRMMGQQAGFPLVPLIAPAARALIPRIGPALGAAGLGAMAENFLDFLPEVGSMFGNGFSPTQSCSNRLPSRVDVPHQTASGSSVTVTYKNMGQPILWTGDLAAVKRVKRVAVRARRALGKR